MTITIGGGSGYGCRGFVVGHTYRHREHGLITVLKSGQRYFHEDGMSFGVGDESGYTYWAECRPATEAEAAPVLRAEAEKEAEKQRLGDLRQFCQDFVGKAEYPEGQDNQPEGDYVPIEKGQTIYGGGSWFVIGSELIWYVINNGADGDDWSRNNVRTGGAGAIGRTLPYSDELRAEILRLTGYDLEGEKVKKETERLEKERKEGNFASEWTLEVTLDRRERWNRNQVAMKKAKKHFNYGELKQMEKDFGSTVDDLKKAVTLHRLPKWEA